MAKKPIQYAVVDAFTAEPFKGNPAAVCLLEAAAKASDDRWLQAVATEFNLSDTAFLLRDSSGVAAPRFQLRWFTPAAEVELCGHATLASAHFLFTSVLAEHDTVVEFATKSGILTAKKVPAPMGASVSSVGKLFIELDFPMIDFFECDNAELKCIPNTLNRASVVSVHRSATVGDLIVELSSAKEVADIIPDIHEIKKCSGRGVVITAPAPAESDYDFFSRFFAPKFGIDEDPVCGSVHCVLAPYWGTKLGKQKLTVFQASPRSGILYLELEAAARRVRIQGEAVTVMTGTACVAAITESSGADYNLPQWPRTNSSNAQCMLDAFAAEPFKVDPAALCLLNDAAEEFKLSHTTFLHRNSDFSAASP